MRAFSAKLRSLRREKTSGTQGVLALRDPVLTLYLGVHGIQLKPRLAGAGVRLYNVKAEKRTGF